MARIGKVECGGECGGVEGVETMRFLCDGINFALFTCTAPINLLHVAKLIG